MGLVPGWTSESPLPKASRSQFRVPRHKRVPALSLFSGIGGLDIGLHSTLERRAQLMLKTGGKLAHAAQLDVRTSAMPCQPRFKAYCERNPKASAILAARMKDMVMDQGPIFEDVRCSIRCHVVHESPCATSCNGDCTHA